MTLKIVLAEGAFGLGVEFIYDPTPHYDLSSLSFPTPPSNPKINPDDKDEDDNPDPTGGTTTSAIPTSTCSNSSSSNPPPPPTLTFPTASFALCAAAANALAVVN
ncbi:hypothetical protein GYMLUDRAFT_245808 [Collybiopsis luxurians FD-317 M1]|uniref:Uncharacterized protein n=1 Tax=Collybiopsis luxurians FD-317 M1 TaxID=944289 RepID=A0A0D0C892_9AGAR|nr:hypothetical protein GYMLUDRAFT_245808 [Collybiopsis luxurians FD-317 M1]